ncbi:MAG: hypothetical protein AAFV95_13150 [Bacteroidota bacterium]
MQKILLRCLTLSGSIVNTFQKLSVKPKMFLGLLLLLLLISGCRAGGCGCPP